MGIVTQIVEAAHAYTHEDVPWEEASRGVMRAHGMNVRQEKAVRCQRRFLLAVLALVVAWSALYFGC